MVSDKCVEEGCSGKFVTKVWRTGQSQSMQPRLIHCIEYTILLVSPIYSCPRGHTCCATDPKIYKQLHHESRPFILLHRTGFTKHFVNTLIHLLSEAMAILAMERFVRGMRQEHSSSLIIQVTNLLPTNFHIEAINYLERCEEIKFLQQPVPSNDVLCKCLLAWFMERRSFYDMEMLAIPIGDYISLDHTFKVPSNIGYTRADGKWVTLYNSVFIVLNDIGQVVTWQFTASTSFSEVETLLADLNVRTDHPVTVFVDNCCQQRQKLREIFGDEITVYLDIFHAIQRLTKAMPKRHPLFNFCISDLKLVFRSPTDIGKTRQSSTPDSGEIMQNLDDFVKKWSNCDYKGWRLFNNKLELQINALKKHITKGCLSDIVEGGGTNKNEALHRHINPHFRNRSRIGLPFALALLSILFYKHNCRVQERKKPIRSTKLKQFLSPLPQTTPSFGVIRKVDSGVSDLSWILGNPSGHCNPAIIEGLTTEECTMENVLITEEAANLLALSDAISIIKNAINMSNIAHSLQNISRNSPQFEYRFLPFMSNLSSILLSQYTKRFPEDDSDKQCNCDKRLDNVLSGWGMKKVNVAKDGNCFFASVAQYMVLNKEIIMQSMPTFFSTCGIQEVLEVSTTIKRLRELLVREWKDHQHDYEGYIVSSDITEEIQLFLQNGYFDSELGNTMVLGLSNALGIPFIVFHLCPTIL